MREETRKIMEPKIIFEDGEVLGVDKPSGMIVNEAASVGEQLTVQKWFEVKYLQQIPVGTGEFFEKGGVVHRLDKDTSGVMVLAKTPGAYDKLKQQFLERRTIKKYLALVHGTFRDSSGEVNKPLERHPKDRHRFTVGGDLSRTAITEWQVKEVFKDKYSLIELTPHTGRTHQLRVHMQYLHHPMVSDPIYGFKKTWKEDFSWCPRLFLHAYYLEFTHPVTGKTQVLEIELPRELKQVLENLVH